MAINTMYGCFLVFFVRHSWYSRRLNTHHWHFLFPRLWRWATVDLDILMQAHREEETTVLKEPAKSLH